MTAKGRYRAARATKNTKEPKTQNITLHKRGADHRTDLVKRTMQIIREGVLLASSRRPKWS